MDLLLQLDGNILLWIQEHLRSDTLNNLWRVITSLGNAGWFWIVLSVIFAIIPKTRKAGVLALFSLALCALITNVWLKNMIARPRPYTQLEDLILLISEPNDWSFPSGHTTASFAAACSYFHGFSKKSYAFAPLILASLIAFSRLYLGAHYPSDVLAGFLIGVCGSWAIYKVYQVHFSYKL